MLLSSIKLCNMSASERPGWRCGCSTGGASGRSSGCTCGVDCAAMSGGGSTRTASTISNSCAADVETGGVDSADIGGAALDCGEVGTGSNCASINAMSWSHCC